MLADNSVATGSILSVATEAEAETAEADAAEADTTYGELTMEGALRLVGALGLGPGDVVADLGSGRGSLAVLAALASGGKAVGIEIDAEPHVTAARRWLGAGPGAGLGVGADVGRHDQGQGLPRRRLVASASRSGSSGGRKRRRKKDGAGKDRRQWRRMLAAVVVGVGVAV